MLQSSISVRFARTLAGIAAASLLAGVISTGAAQAGKNEFPERLPGSGHRPKDDAELDPIDVSYVWLREMQRHFEPGGFRLGMYGTPGASSDGWAGAQFSTTRNNGYGLTDTAGLLPAGARSPSFRAVTGGGGVAATVDLTRYFDLSANEQLFLGGAFDARTTTTSYGSTPNLLAAGIIEAGSLRQNDYRLTLLGATASTACI
jgi:hypothetical protein